MRHLNTFFVLFFAFILFAALPQEAEARRMGGGSNLGKQYSVPKRDTTTTTTTTAPKQDATATAAGAAARPSGASRWFGPLAGLAAGGLIAALLFGDGFEGLQLFDLVLIAALMFGVVLLFRAMRPRPVAQPAGGPPLAGGFPPYESGQDAAAPRAAGAAMEMPTWFDAEDFLKGARVHFIRLQAAWDKGDMKDIATYTTPELYAALQAERLASGDLTGYTEVGYLDAELTHVQRDGDKVVVTIRYAGGIKDAPEAETVPFTELWHVVHGWESAAGDWYVAGIQQVDDDRLGN